MSELIFLVEQFPLYLLVLIRTAGLIGTAPIFQHGAIPMQVKASLTAILAFILMASMPPEAWRHLVLPDTILGWTFIVIREAAVGLTLGFVASMVVTAVVAAGEFAARDMGLSVAAEFNPDIEMETTPISTLYLVMFSLAILVLDVHHWFILALVRSYELVPIDKFAISLELNGKLIEMMSWIYVVGVKVAAPVMAIQFLMAVAIGIMSRAAPQVNILLISFPIRLAVGLVVLGLSVHILTADFEKLLLKMGEDMEIVMRLMGSQ